MIEIISTGRKLKDAIDNGLMQLGKSLEEVEVEILDNGGLFRKAKVKIKVDGGDEPVTVPEKKEQPIAVEKSVVKQNAEQTPQEKREKPAKERHEHKEFKKEYKKDFARRENKERKENKPNAAKTPSNETQVQPAEKVEKKEPRHYEPVTVEVAKKAEDFVTELIAKMGVEATVETSIAEGELFINLTSSASTLIGYHGEVLDSIEYLTSYVINRENDKFYHVVVNCNGYREKRKESLVALANKMAAKCIKVRHKIVLEPMNSNERKIIHSALSSNDQIITRSEGHEPNRHIVILCKKR